MRSNFLLLIAFSLMLTTFAFAGKLPQQAQSQKQRGQDSGSVAATESGASETNVETLQERAVKLRERLKGTEFTVVVESPFVVIGNQKSEEVQRWAAGTIRWSVAKLKQEYFAKDPNSIIEIWLFRDAATYMSGAKSLVGYEPGTPYGFYSSDHKVLVMNISTGGGTLVHEIVHPFIESNFPGCPSWFNEGLASLYEQSAEKNSRIVGLTNWRLRGLQLGIRDRRLGSFEELTSTTTREFYDGDGTNYAQARYLCYWLQENGKLKAFYESFVANLKQDPTGLESLKLQIAPQGIGEFQQAWEKWVLGLRFRG